MYGLRHISPHQAVYFAQDLTRRAASGMDRLTMSLFDAAVDLNPHQIEAALFALESPLSKGVILADEVGLGKTIEAGIVLCQLWAERKRKLLVLAPASLRKQWAMELEEKFNLPTLVLDARSYRELLKQHRSPFSETAILILSYHFAYRLQEEIASVPWDLVVIDEAHKLRNAYRPSNKVGQAIRQAIDGRRKLLLTATPLQNSLLELYGLTTLIDPHLFGDVSAFRAQYMNAGANLEELRGRLRGFVKRTLREQVVEYIRYTERRAITRPFKPTDEEHAFYEAVSAFLRRPDSYALPKRQRHLTALILRKLLASSPEAVAGTLELMAQRLEALRDKQQARDEADLIEELVEGEELEPDLLDELLNQNGDKAVDEAEQSAIDRKKLQSEIDELRRLTAWARSLRGDTKAQALLKALEIGLREMARVGANRKALIFTESRRTQEYLKRFLEANGYAGQVVLFNGTNSGPEATAIYERWRERNQNTGRVTGSRPVDIRTALIEHFRDKASIMITTEAGAEGVNLQFCSLVINYDLPWNPQRIEQRIGRVHRYGQKHDVVVINFLNERNEADRRVLELLEQKFRLFSGLFGASDEVLGAIESGIDFEKRILAIYQESRTPEEIDAAFEKLQAELDEQIKNRLKEAQETLLEHFDEDVHERLKLRLADAQAQLDRVGKRFWALTRHTLAQRANFDDNRLVFDLHSPPQDGIPPGRYHLISKSPPPEAGGQERRTTSDGFLYRLSHPLGQYVLSEAKGLATPVAEVVFDVSNHPTRVSAVEAIKGKAGFLTLALLAIESYEREEHLLFSGFDDEGSSLDQETMDKLFGVSGRVGGEVAIPAAVESRLAAEIERHARATINRSLEANNRHFQEAREKLERWADDMVLAAEKALKDTKEKIKALQRQARQAETLEEQRELQEQIRKLEKQKRRQRAEIFRVEDEIMEKRDRLIDELEKKLTQKTELNRIFTIRWKVV